MESNAVLWTPDQSTIERANLTALIQWLRLHKQLAFDNYHELWNWSVSNVDTFWTIIWEYFEIQHDGNFTHAYQGQMPEVGWFEGTSLNYAEHVFRKAINTHPAIIFKNESAEVIEVSWQDLKEQVASLQYFLKERGVTIGDRVAAYVPCIPEASVSMLATVSLGAVWSSCSPDFGTQAVIDRFAQIEPVVLIAVDEYHYGGKRFDKSGVVQDIVNAIPSLKTVVLITNKNQLSRDQFFSWEQIISQRKQYISFTRVPFNHPIWILYSSGTTGLPKAITHSQGGILLEQLKYGTFHNDFKTGERCFWYTTTGWMMWNYIHASLLCGGTMVIYDGSPAYPDLHVLWQLADDTNISHFGTSAGFILANIKAGIQPNKQFHLAALRSIGSTGSTLPPEGFDWIYQYVKNSVWLASMSGGTDVCSAFVGGNPTWPVHSGEIQCRALGCDLHAFNDAGEKIEGEVGEMVITSPMPSMPLFFWNDPDFKRYRESYFETYPGVWRHGDWIEVTAHQGIIIYGRSDATLNRGGVRIGTSEIYRSVDVVPEVKDSLIICIEKSGGEFWMPLFVLMKDGFELSEEVRKKINHAIRSAYSPRHVPDEIIAVPDIPYTISGKKTETPVKKVLMGKDLKSVINPGSLRNPASMDFFVALYKQQNQPPVS